MREAAQREERVQRAEKLKVLLPYIVINEQREGWEHRTESKAVQALRAALTHAFTSSSPPHASSAPSTSTSSIASSQRPKRRKATAADRTVGLSNLSIHDTFDPNVVSLILEYAEEVPCLHNTFFPRLEPATGLSPLFSKWGGVPYLHTGESWPLCGRCEAPLSFFFQIRQGDYPTILQHAYTAPPQAQPPATSTDPHQPQNNKEHTQQRGSQDRNKKRALHSDSDKGTVDDERNGAKEDDGGEEKVSEHKKGEKPEVAVESAKTASRRDSMLFQFFLCTSCTPQYQHSRLPEQDEHSEDSSAALIRLVDPSLRPPIAGLSAEVESVYDEQRLVGWTEQEDFPGCDEMEAILEEVITRASSSASSPAIDRHSLEQAASLLEDHAPAHTCDRMGGYPYW